MSRVAKIPIIVPTNVNLEINSQVVVIEGNKGKLTYILSKSVRIECKDNVLIVHPREDHVDGRSQAGTTRTLLNSMIIGVTKGFTKKLQLVGIGYRVELENNIISLFVGFSHPINYPLPYGVTAECPSQFEIVLKSANKQVLGQVAANLRAYRSPEPYKGKGIRYIDEIVHLKEAKKK